MWMRGCVCSGNEGSRRECILILRKGVPEIFPYLSHVLLLKSRTIWPPYQQQLLLSEEPHGRFKETCRESRDCSAISHTGRRGGEVEETLARRRRDTREEVCMKMSADCSPALPPAPSSSPASRRQKMASMRSTGKLWGPFSDASLAFSTCVHALTPTCLTFVFRNNSWRLS